MEIPQKQRDVIRGWIDKAIKALDLNYLYLMVIYAPKSKDEDAFTKVAINKTSIILTIYEEDFSKLWIELGKEECRQIIFNEIFYVFLNTNDPDVLTTKITYVLSDLLYNK